MGDRARILIFHVTAIAGAPPELRRCLRVSVRKMIVLYFFYFIIGFGIY